MKKLVFIVEDNLVQQKLLKLHFEQSLEDYDVKAYDHPDSMMENLHDKPYAVILDHLFDMDDKTGLDYLKILKVKYKSIPVIYYTSLDDQKLREEVLALGAEQYIIKNSASLVNLRTALDVLHVKKQKMSFFKRLFGK